MTLRIRNTRLSGLGDNCGDNPCGFFDMFPFPGIFTSAECNAYISCEGATSVGIVPGGGATGTGSNTQASCTITGGTWDPTSSTCTPPGYTQYLPWIFGGIAVIFLGGMILGKK